MKRLPGVNMDLVNELMYGSAGDPRRERNKVRVAREAAENLASAAKRAAEGRIRIVDVGSKRVHVHSAMAPASSPAPDLKKRKPLKVRQLPQTERPVESYLPEILQKAGKLRSSLFRVFLKLANGGSDEEIGRSLGLGTASVKTYRAALSTEFDLHGLKHVVRAAILAEASRQYVALHPELGIPVPPKQSLAQEIVSDDTSVNEAIRQIRAGQRVPLRIVLRTVLELRQGRSNRQVADELGLGATITGRNWISRIAQLERLTDPAWELIEAAERSGRTVEGVAYRAATGAQYEQVGLLRKILEA